LEWDHNHEEEFPEDFIALTVFEGFLKSLNGLQIKEFYPNVYLLFQQLRISNYRFRRNRGEGARFVRYSYEWENLSCDFRASLAFDIRHQKQEVLYERGLKLNYCCPDIFPVNRSHYFVIHFRYHEQALLWHVCDSDNLDLRIFDEFVRKYLCDHARK